MFKQILVPLDSSKVAEEILPLVKTLAQKLNAQVELFGVVEPEGVRALATSKEGSPLESLEAKAKTMAQAYLQRTAETLHLPPDTITTRVVVAKADAAILKEASSVVDTLIAMSTHGRSGVARWVFGSVTDKVLHSTATPLLLFRSVAEGAAPKETPLTSVIVPLDGSELAESVLPYAEELAKAMDLEIILVRVTSFPVSYASAEGMYVPSQDLLDAIEKEAEDYLAAKVQELGQRGLKKVSSRSLRGNASERIVNLARNTPGSLVALSTHGRSGPARWVFGSVADRVVRHSGGPVLVIAPKA
ncbi:MAG: universal stress protein [Chloroflexi bacterium]|nr:universal stress protein [Chloroflexota bacterium]